ncbi:hypothetical protein BH09ACT10_BH09ACT10_04420 [soil metagenome]
MASKSSVETHPLRAWCALILVLLARAYRAFLLTLVAAAFVPLLWGWSSFVVESGSMEPGLSVGDVVVGKPVVEGAPILVGRVMIFTRPLAGSDQNVIHRVVKSLGQGTYATAGDANRSNDVDPVPLDKFRARATICVPFVGLPLIWWRSHDFALLLLWIAGTVAAFYLSSRPTCRKKHRRAQEGAKEPVVMAPVRKFGRGAAALAAATALVVAGTTLFAPERAGAAFSADTVNAGSRWQVAAVTSRATSRIQVYDTAADSGWYRRSSVAVNISATASGAASVRSISYRVNGGGITTSKTASLTFTLSTQGDNIITYFATDSFGAAESPHTAHIKLDNQSPALAVTSRVGDVTHAQWRAACAPLNVTGAVCGTVVDGTAGSGVSSVTYILFRSSDQTCFNGTSWTSAACSTRRPSTLGPGTFMVAVPDSALPAARTWYTITLYAEDVAGNSTNTTKNFSVG